MLAMPRRYSILNAILVELEGIPTASLGDLEEARALLILAGEIAEAGGRTDEQVIAEEREAFCRYIGSLRQSDLAAVQPLPFRRVLTTAESGRLWTSLRERWKVNAHRGVWYPLSPSAVPGVVAFQQRAFEEVATLDHLRGVLRARGQERVWELREYGPEYEKDVSLFEPGYNGAEGYWSSGELDWIVYASHHDSVTVGGWLLDGLMAVWPSWADHLWGRWPAEDR
jgi:hypothetical protein